MYSRKATVNNRAEMAVGDKHTSLLHDRSKNVL